MSEATGTLTPVIEEDGMITLKRAREIAFAAHAGQKDKIGDPYWMHLEAVRDGVKFLGGDLQVQAAAILHDAVEDTDLKPLPTKSAGYEQGKRVTYAVLREEGASERQITAIKAVTKVTGSVQSAYLDGIVEAGIDAIMIKLADLMHNMRPDRRARITTPGTKERLQKKYSPSIARLMKELGYLLTEEALATIPQGSTSYYGSGSGISGGTDWGMRSTSWLMKGDEVKVSGKAVLIVAKDKVQVLGEPGAKKKKEDYVVYSLEDGTTLTVHTNARVEGRMKGSGYYSSPYTPKTTTGTSSGVGSSPKPGASNPVSTPAFSDSAEDFEGWGIF